MMSSIRRKHPSSRRGKIYDEADAAERKEDVAWDVLIFGWRFALFSWVLTNLHRLPLPGGRRNRRPGKTY